MIRDPIFVGGSPRTPTQRIFDVLLTVAAGVILWAVLWMAVVS